MLCSHAANQARMSQVERRRKKHAYYYLNSKWLGGRKNVFFIFSDAPDGSVVRAVKRLGKRDYRACFPLFVRLYTR